MTTEVMQPCDSDNRIYLASPNTNYSTDTDLRIGESTSDVNLVARTLLKFNKLYNGTIPANAIVTSAILSLYLWNDLATSASTVRVFRLKRAWNEAQSTWNSYSDGNNWATPGGFHADDCEQTDIGSLALGAAEAAGWREWELTPSAIQAIISGSWANNGFLLKTDSELSDMYRYYSSEYATDTTKQPKLTVIYTTPAGIPKVKSFNGVLMGNAKTVNGLAVASVKSVLGQV